MQNSIRPNDILWTRNGDPIVVDKTDEQTGKLYTDNNFSRVQETAKNGVKNGLNQEERAAFKSTLSDVQNSDKKKEILELHEKIKSLKENKSDSRLLKYLDNELQYRIVRDDFKPNDYAIQPITLDI